MNRRLRTWISTGILAIVLSVPGLTDAQSVIWERHTRTDAAQPKPTWFGVGTERGIAYGVVGGLERVYVVSRNGGNAIRAVDPTTGADVTLPNAFTVTGVSGGLFAINDIEVSDDGVVVAANMTTNTNTAPFKAYIWTTEGGDPAVTYSFDPAGDGVRRLGDKIAVVGSWSAGTFELWTISPPITTPAETGRIYVHRTNNQGQSWTVQEIELSATLAANATFAGNAGIRPMGPGGDKDFFVNSNGANLKRYTSTGAYVDGSAVGTSTGFSGVDLHVTGAQTLAFNYQYRVASNADPIIGTITQYDVTTPNAPTFVGALPYMASAAVGSTAVTGDVSVKSNPDGTWQVFGLGTDQGIMSYGTVYTEPPPPPASLRLAEYFEYETGSLLTANGWTAHSGGGTSSLTVGQAGLTYAGYTGSGMGKSVTYGPTGEDVNRTFGEAITSGSMYAGFLVAVTSASTNGDYFFHVGATSMGTTFFGRVFVKADANGKLAFGLQKMSGTGASTTYSDHVYEVGKTYLLVLKYDFVDGDANDVMALAVNPAGSALPESWTVTNSVAVDAANMGTVALRQGSSTAGLVVTVSGIRIGTDYAEVVGNPVPPPPPPMAGVYRIPQGAAPQGFPLLSDAVAYLNANGASAPVVFEIAENLIDTVAIIQVNRQDLTESTPVTIMPAEGTTPVVELRGFHNLGTDHFNIFGIRSMPDEVTTAAKARPADSSFRGEGTDKSQFVPVPNAYGDRGLTFVQSHAGSVFFLYEGAIMENSVVSVSFGMNGTVGAGTTGFRINRKDAAGAGQGGADGIMLINNEIGRPGDAGHFQTGVNVWGSSSGAFPASNVTLLLNDFHVGQRGVSTQVFRDATFQQNHIWVYGHATTTSHIGFDVNTPVGMLTIAGNEIKQMRSIRSDATTMMGINLTNSLNDDGVYIINNMFAMNHTTTTGATNHNVYGIAHGGASSVADVYVYHNTIQINNTGSTGVHAGIIQTTGSNNTPFYTYNNMFVVRNSVGFGASWNGMNLLSDHNNYFAPVLARRAGVDYTTIGDLQAANYDRHSVSSDVEFVSATDLRLTGPSLGNPMLAGVEDTYIMFDIDGNFRSQLAPYMGAFEGPALPRYFLNFELQAPADNAIVELQETSTEPISITWEETWSTEAWGRSGATFASDNFAHAGNGASGAGKYIGTELNRSGYVRTPILQNSGTLSFWAANYNTDNVFSVVVELTIDGETWSQIDTLHSKADGSGEITFTWTKFEFDLNLLAPHAVRLRAETTNGAVYFDDFVVSSFTGEGNSYEQDFESWTAFESMTYTWLYDETGGDFSSPLLSITSDDDGNLASLTLTHAELDAALESIGVTKGNATTGIWTVHASYRADREQFARAPHGISMRRIVDSSVETDDQALTFKLDQNYPNPFNPTTTIRYSVPVQTQVRLDVFTVTGQRVATLVNDMKPAGFHTVAFDASNLASGVYFYRIQAGSFTETFKMTLVK